MTKEFIKTKNLTKSRLGLSFEELINKSNDYFREKEIAVIYKKPTPIQVVKVSYPIRSRAKITDAYYKLPSTTDYNGIYKGLYIDFEAKSCKEKLFSFERIYPHQIKHLEFIERMGGIAFLIIEFSSLNEVYLLKASILYNLYINSLNGGRKSIKYETFIEKGIQVKKENDILLYLDGVDVLIQNRC